MTELEFRKTYRNWFKCLSDSFPANKANIIKFYKSHMDSAPADLMRQFHTQASPFFEVLLMEGAANNYEDNDFFNTCAGFYADIEYHTMLTTTEKGREKDFRKQQLVFLNHLCYFANALLSKDTTLAYKFLINAQTLQGMADILESAATQTSVAEMAEMAAAAAAGAGAGGSSDVFNNPLLSSLAEEISKEVQIPDSFKNIESPQDIFKLMMNKDGKDFMEEMVKTVSGKIQDKIKNGELNEHDLFAQAQSMMGSVFQNNPMFGNLSSMFGGGGGGGEASAAVVAANEQQRKTELRKALREKYKNKRH
jgi:hypothetical protein